VIPKRGVCEANERQDRQATPNPTRSRQKRHTAWRITAAKPIRCGAEQASDHRPSRRSARAGRQHPLGFGNGVFAGTFLAGLLLPDGNRSQKPLKGHRPGTKINPGQSTLPGSLQVLPQLVGFCDSGGWGVGGWDAVRIGPTTLPLVSRFFPFKCDVCHPVMENETVSEKGKCPSAHCTASTPKMTTSQPIVSIVEAPLRKAAFHTSTLNGV
jgi:hypothetical protein